MSRNTVLHLGAGGVYGGVESFLETLARRARATRPVFTLCSQGRLHDELVAAGRGVHLLPAVRLSRPWQVLRARRAFARTLAEQRPDAALCHSGWLQILFGPVLRRHRVAMAVWIHSVDTDRPWIEALARRHPPAVVLLASRYLDALTRAWYPGLPRRIIPLPVPVPERSTPGLRASVRRGLGTAAEDVVLVIACRFEGWKGHATLLEALARLRDVPGWKLWIAGGAQSGPEAARVEDLRARAAASGIAGRVVFAGQRSDVPTLLQAADIHCQPNTGPEPFGIAFVEALHAGIPVVSTAIGGAAEIIDATCGVLVPPADAAALAEALLGLIGDPARRAALGVAGRERAALLYDPERKVAAVETALLDIMSAGVGAH